MWVVEQSVAAKSGMTRLTLEVDALVTARQIVTVMLLDHMTVSLTRLKFQKLDPATDL